jgi:hypothetical protein
LLPEIGHSRLWIDVSVAGKSDHQPDLTGNNYSVGHVIVFADMNAIWTING